MTKTTHSLSKKKGYRIVFLASLLFTSFFETILFIFFQVDGIKKMLNDDFAVVVAVADAKSQDVIKKLEGNKFVKSMNYRSKDEILDELKKDDEELYLSVSSVNKNPIPDIIKLKIKDEYLGNIDKIVDSISNIDGIIDIRYKPDEIVAIMHVNFYYNFFFVTIVFSILIVSLIIFMGILHVGVSNFFDSVKESLKWFLDGVMGSSVAIFFVYIIVYPVKYISPFWHWPSVFWHLLSLLSGGFLGWVLYQWKKN